MSVYSTLKKHHKERAKREQQLLMIFVMVMSLLIGDMITHPILQEITTQQNLITQKTDEYQSLEKIQRALSEELAPKTTQKKIEISEQKKQELAQLKIKFKNETGDMLNSDETYQVLQQLFHNARSLSLESLKSLKPLPLKGYEDLSSVSGTDMIEAAESPTAQPHSLQANGFEIALKGDYFSTLRFIRQLESMKENIFWNQFSYTVNNYPNADIFIKIYSISFAKGLQDID